MLPFGRVAAVRVAAVVLLVVSVLGAAVALAPDASAHATVAASDPADGARLGKAPARVSVTFDEPVGIGLGYLRVITARGVDVGDGAASHPDGQGQVVALALKPGLGQGTYIASWRVTSADSHPIQGTFRFVVGSGVLAAATGPVGLVDPGSTSTALDIARTGSYAALALLGGGWLLLVLWPAGRRNPAARRVLVTGWVLGLAGAAAELLLQGPYAAGIGLGGIWRFGLLTETLSTLYGRLHLARLFLLAGLGVGITIMLSPAAADRRSQPGSGSALRGAWAGPALFLCVVFTVSAGGHAGVARPAWLAVSSDMAHLTAASAWLGGLVMLAAALLPGRDPDQLRAVLPTFSRVAFWCVVLIAVTGTYQAWRESGSVVALLVTSYGRLVLLKIALFAGLLIAAAESRTAVQRRFARPPLAPAAPPAAPPGPDTHQPVPTVAAVPVGAVPDPADPARDLLQLNPGKIDEHQQIPQQMRGLRRSVLIELLIAAVVLTVSSVLVALPPARVAAALPPAPATFVAASADTALDTGRSATITVIPSGHNDTFTVTLALHGGPVPTQITTIASLPAQQLGPLPIPLRPSGPQTYQAYEVLLPGTGLWTFTITVRTTEFDAITATATINIF